MNKRNPFFKALVLFALFVTNYSFFGCSSESDENQSYELVITPNGSSIEQTQTATFTATLQPVPSTPVTFDWFTLAIHGTISDEMPNGQFIETSSDGTSSLVYTATAIGNPGGVEVLSLDVLNASGTILAESVIEIEVGPPTEQIVPGVLFEWTRPSGNPGRLSTSFIVAWPFFKLPGFNSYDFTLEVEPGEGWDLGEIGNVLTASTSSGIIDGEASIDEYDGDHFNLGNEKYALVSFGGGYSNYLPGDSNALEAIENARDFNGRLAMAVYKVTGHGSIVD